MTGEADTKDMADYVTSEVSNGVGLLTISRPGRLNALGTDVLKAIDQELKQLAGDVTVVRLRTAGERAFIAGADMKEFGDLSHQSEFAAFLDTQREINETIESHPAIVIAEVDGIAYGGGFELALATDMIIASENAKFGFPEISNGWLPGGGGTQRLPRIVGLPKAKELILTSTPISATEAERLGIVNRVVPHGRLSEDAQSFAEELLESAPLALQDGKRLCNAGVDASLDTALEFERDLVLKLFETDDAAEGLRAFQENRDPEFTGN